MSFTPCIVVPVYNHAEAVRSLVEKLEPLGLPAILVNDGCAPVEADSLRRLAESHDWVQLLEHSQNQGKGAAVMSGLREAFARGFSHALQIDADGQHDTSDIPRFLAVVRKRPEVIVTGRPVYDASVPRGRLIARYLTHAWVWIETLSFTIRDSMCGFRVYPLEPVIDLLERARIGRRMDFDSEILVRLSWMGLSVVSLPTRVIYPAGGQSHFRLVHDNALITRMHVRLFFGMLWRLPQLLGRRLGGFPKPLGLRRGRLDEC